MHKAHLAWPWEQGGESLLPVPMSSKSCDGDRGVQILWQESMAPCFLLCHWVFNILFLSSNHSQLLSHGFLRLLLIHAEMLLQEHTGTWPPSHSFVSLSAPSSPSFFSLSLSSLLWQGKERKGNTSEMKD